MNGRPSELAALVLLALLCGTARGQDAASVPDAERVFLETDVPGGPVHVRQPLRVTLRVGIDRAFFEGHVVQLFARRLTVPVHVTAPWWNELADAHQCLLIENSGAATAADTGTPPATLALNDDVVRARRVEDRSVDGRDFSVFEVSRTLLPLLAGTRELAAPTVRFAYGNAFRGDLFDDRVALDRVDVRAEGARAAVEVLALPEEGRPASYAGGVGRFAVRLALSRTRVAPAEHFELRLSVESIGAGDVRSWNPPRLDVLEPLHVFGVLDDHRVPLRTFTYDVAVEDARAPIAPSVEVSWFEPGPEPRYHVEAVPLPRYDLALPGPVSADAEDGPAAAVEESGEAPKERGLLFGVVAVALLSFLAVLWLRLSRRRAPPVVDATPLSRLRQRLDVAGPGGDAALADALSGYLAERLQCEPAAVIGPDLSFRLEHAGVPGDLARRTADTLEHLVAVRYGGQSGRHVEADVWALAEDLDGALHA